MANHGVFVSEQATSVGTPVVSGSGIPFVVGCAPVQSGTASKIGVPVLCTSWAEATEKLGYCDNWKDYGLCQFMYAHFKLFACQPVIFCNVLDLTHMKKVVPATDFSLSDHKIKLPLEAIDDETLVVKMAGDTGTALVKDSDYSSYYDGEYLVIEALPDGTCFEAEQLSVTYSKVNPKTVDKTTVANGFECVELCMTLFGLVPDLLCAPGFSDDPTVAAVMATKASGINGMFRAKALIDISATEEGAESYTEAIAGKKNSNLVDPNQIVCWPMVKLGDKLFHMSTQLAGLMAKVDSENGGCPYESPSNKGFQCNALVLADGTEVNLSLAQANILNANGITTALNFMGGWVCWGNYTACYPANTDVKDYYIPVSRMFDWIGNTLIRTFWSRLDKPMNRRLIDTVLDTANIWLNGLVGSGYLLGARAVMLADENPGTALMAGIIKIHLYMTPPAPAQEINFVLEYDANYVSSALQS